MTGVRLSEQDLDALRARGLRVREGGRRPPSHAAPDRDPGCPSRPGESAGGLASGRTLALNARDAGVTAGETAPDFTRGGAAAARLAHNQEVAGASPARASTPPPRSRGAGSRRQKPEDALQVACAQLLDRALDPAWRWFHVPNGGARSKAEAGQMKAFGVKAGAPDVLILGPAGQWVWIELKARDGALSRGQRAFRDWCRAHGRPWFMVRSLDHLIEALATAEVPMRLRPEKPDAGRNHRAFRGMHSE